MTTLRCRHCQNDAQFICVDCSAPICALHWVYVNSKQKEAGRPNLCLECNKKGKTKKSRILCFISRFKNK